MSSSLSLQSRLKLTLPNLISAPSNLLPENLKLFLTTLALAISALILICIVQPIFIAVMVPMLVCYYFAQAFYRASARELKRIDSISKSPLYAHFSETLSGLSTIRAYGAADRFITENERKLDYNGRVYYQVQLVPRWLSIRLEFFSAILIFGTTLVACFGKGAGVSVSLLALTVTYSLNLTGSFTWVVRQLSETEQQMNGVERLLYYAEELEQEAPDASEPGKQPPDVWPAQGKIEFRQLEMRYRPDLPAVLKRINLTVEPGERLGIVGRTGAGKSSITVALFRLVEASHGGIWIDDVDIGQIGLFDLRSRLSIIPQDPVLFSSTVRYNLDPFNEYTDDQLWGVLDRCGDLHDLIASNPLKLDAPVAENADNFSVGQKQLICLARALLRKSRVLVLDEATASVDHSTDLVIQKTLSEVKDRTILTVAHRLNTVVTYDRILVLDHGQVAQIGRPYDLLQDSDGPFRKLVEQTGGANFDVLFRMAAEAAGVSVDADETVGGAANNLSTGGENVGAGNNV